MNALNDLERRFINRFQGGFPLTARPFSHAAGQLGTREADLIRSVASLLERGFLSRFGPLYDAERLGGAVTLSALEVPPADYDRVAAQVNALPTVAHNYRREHRLNMWFVLASEQPAGITAALEEIEQCTGLTVYDFPRQRAFYLGLWLHLDGHGGVDTRPADASSVSVDQGAPESGAADDTAVQTATRAAVTDAGAAVPPGTDAAEDTDSQTNRQPDTLDRELLRATQHGLPLCRDPWSRLAGQLDRTPGEILARLRAMLATGVIRRIGAVPNHYRLGLRGNGMSVWDVPDEVAARLGREIGALDCVSHCYLRPRHEGVWPYNLFAMLHGCDRETVLARAERIERLLGPHCRGHDILFSTAVLKKTGLRLAA